MHVLVIGASVIDVFLDVDTKFTKIEDGTVSLKLGDKIPSDLKTLALGGNGANVAAGLTRLEIPTTFFTYLGDDALSRELEEGMTREGVELAAARGQQKSSSLSIIFGFASDRIIFSHHETHDYTFDFNKPGNYDFIYLTSIGERWEKAYDEILEYSRKNKTGIAFSPGIHQLENMNQTVKDIIHESKIYFSNREEAEIVLGKKDIDIKEILTGIKALGPEVASITDGGEGAYAIDRESNMYFIKPPPSEGHEKTGAGDAYSTGFFASYLHGNDIPSAMLWGALDATGVIEQLGAQKGLLTKKEIDIQLKDVSIPKAEKI